MRKINNLLKGLLVALVIICVGGLIALSFKVTPSKMMLISSSIVNSIAGKNSINENQEEKISESEEVLEEENEEVKLDIESVSQEEKEEATSNSQTDSTIESNTLENETPKEDDTTIPKEETNPNNDQALIEDTKEEIVVKGEYEPNLEVASTTEVIETYYGKMTGYGPDCIGCSGITASGMNVLNGNIYYEDETFGNIRIVAGDKSIPFGSIIRISGVSIATEPILAIVLDRGGMIGFETWKQSYFDLLFESEQAAIPVGRQDATFELLRLGY